jgi:hypothetical protein
MKEFEPAFPILDSTEAGLSLRHAGMGLRDYFAAAALQGILASNGDVKYDTFEAAAHDVCTTAYEYADMMLAVKHDTQLNKQVGK